MLLTANTLESSFRAKPRKTENRDTIPCQAKSPPRMHPLPRELVHLGTSLLFLKCLQCGEQVSRVEDRFVNLCATQRESAASIAGVGKGMISFEQVRVWFGRPEIVMMCILPSVGIKRSTKR